MQPHTDMELIFAAVLHEVLIAANTSRFKGFGTELFIFIGNQMNTEGEIIDSGLLLAQIEDTDLGVGDTTTEPGFRIRLVLTVAITENQIASNN